MTAAEFVKKWAASTGTERAASHEHFIRGLRSFFEGVEVPTGVGFVGGLLAQQAAQVTGDGKSQAQLEEENSAAIVELG